MNIRDELESRPLSVGSDAYLTSSLYVDDQCFDNTGSSTSRQRSKSVTVSRLATNSARRKDDQSKQRKSASSRCRSRSMKQHTSKGELLRESAARLYAQKPQHIIPHRHVCHEMTCGMRLRQQQRITMQKRARYHNQRATHKFEPITKRKTCHDLNVLAAKTMLYEPSKSMNMSNFCHRNLEKPVIRFDCHKVRPRRDHHLATGKETGTLNMMQSYHRVQRLMEGSYKQSLKGFFGKQYDLKTGHDPGYSSLQSTHKERPLHKLRHL